MDVQNKAKAYWCQFYKLICLSKYTSADEKVMIAEMIDKREELGEQFEYIDKARTYGYKVKNHGNDCDFIHSIDQKSKSINRYLVRNKFQDLQNS